MLCGVWQEKKKRLCRQCSSECVMHLGSSTMYMAVEKVGNALDSPKSTRGTLGHKACFLSPLCGQSMRRYAPKCLAPGHPLGFHHASSTETFYSRHLGSSLQIPQKTVPVCSTSLGPFLILTDLGSSCPWETCSHSSSLETE